MAFNFPIRRASDPLKKECLTIVLIGDPGGGKTTLALTSGGMHQDWNRGIHRAVQKHRGDGMDPTDFADFGQFKSLIMSESYGPFLKSEGFTAQVIDTVGSMAKDFMMPWLQKVNPAASNRDGTFSLKGYGALGETFLAIINRFEELGQHSIFIAHAQDNGAETIPRYTIKMPGSSSDTIEERADLIGYISKEKGKRYLEFDATSLHIGKNAPGFPKMELPDPESPEFTGWLEREIIEPALLHFSKMSEEALEIGEQVKGFAEDVEAADSPGAFANITEALKTVAHDGIKRQVRGLLRAAMKKQGVVYVAADNEFKWSTEKQALIDAKADDDKAEEKESKPKKAPKKKAPAKKPKAKPKADAPGNDHGMTKEEREDA